MRVAGGQFSYPGTQRNEISASNGPAHRMSLAAEK